MLILDGKEHRARLGFPCHYTVILPDSSVSGKVCPLILCLHELGEGRQKLIFDAQLQTLADEFGAALLVPDGRRSCFLDMAQGPAWATFHAEEQIKRMQHDFRIKKEITGVIGMGAGALGALQICRHTEATSFVCVAIDPDAEMPFVREKEKWPREQEWIGVFQGTEEEWAPEGFISTKGCLMGSKEAITSCSKRFGLNGWTLSEEMGSLPEKWRKAVAYCKNAMEAVSE